MQRRVTGTYYEATCKRTQQLPIMLRVIGHQCCVRLHGAKSLTGFKLCATTCSRVTSNNVKSCSPTMLPLFARGLKEVESLVLTGIISLSKKTYFWRIRENPTDVTGKKSFRAEFPSLLLFLLISRTCILLSSFLCCSGPHKRAIVLCLCQ